MSTQLSLALGRPSEPQHIVNTVMGRGFVMQSSTTWMLRKAAAQTPCTGMQW